MELKETGLRMQFGLCIEVLRNGEIWYKHRNRIIILTYIKAFDRWTSNQSSIIKRLSYIISSNNSHLVDMINAEGFRRRLSPRVVFA